jgi:hypothetical protein
MNRPAPAQCAEHARCWPMRLLRRFHGGGSQINPDCRAVLITGAEGNFAAGADITEIAPGRRPLTPPSDPRKAHWTAIRAFSKPLVAAVEGYALGGGLELALMADFLVAGPDRPSLAFRRPIFGVIPGAGGGQRLMALASAGPAPTPNGIDRRNHRRRNRASPGASASHFSEGTRPEPKPQRLTAKARQTVRQLALQWPPRRHLSPGPKQRRLPLPRNAQAFEALHRLPPTSREGIPRLP